MADLIQIIGIIFEIIAFIGSFMMGFFVYRKNSGYLGNRLMAAGAILIGLYPGATLIYDIFPTETSINVWMRVGNISVMFGAVFLYFSIQVLVHTTVWWNKKLSWIPVLVACTLISIYLIITDYITIHDLDTTVNSSLDLTPLIFVILVVLVSIVYSIFDLYIIGVKNSEGESKKKMIRCLIGMIVNLLAIAIVILTNILENQNVAAVLDVFIFIFLAIGISIMASSFN